MASDANSTIMAPNWNRVYVEKIMPLMCYVHTNN